MKEIIKSFAKSDNPVFSIQLCGISYCDGSYVIRRPCSIINCFEYIISGCGTIVVKGQKYYPKEGDVYFLKAGEDHYYYSDSEKPWTKIWFNVKGGLVDSLMNQYGIADICLFENCRVHSLFEEFVSNASSNMDLRTVENQNSIVLHRVIQDMAQCVHTYTSSYSEDALMMKEFIDANFNRHVTTKDLASVIYRSQSQTIRIFKKNFGVAPYEYALRRKMQVASQLLKNTRMPIREIAGYVGFANEHYFSSSFKLHTGMTPGKYRKN